MAKLQHRASVFALALGSWASLTNCGSAHAGSEPSIEITRIPPAGEGSPDRLDRIEGRIKGARPGERVVLFALSGVWWVQPEATEPFTAVQSDATWKNSTHPGSAYAALLVDSRYRPPLTVNALPAKGGPVLAIATVSGATGASPAAAPIRFSGYQWEALDTGGNHGGTGNFYTPANVWTDGKGFIHLRVSKQAEQWAGAEVRLSRSLGYGSYRFVVCDVSRLEPAAVFALFTWDDLGPPREVDIEVSRWGEPKDKNAQYVIQPYVVPANTVRFDTPAGVLTWWIDWEPGRVSFRTIRGSGSNNRPEDVVAEHVFTSGVPSAGNERIHMNLYAYGNKRHALQHEFEVIIEKFEFLP